MTATAPAIPQPATPTRKPRGDILVTAFEPSGDDHAAVLIAELKRRHPDLTIHALGGPKMEAAGAHLIARTCDDAVLGVPTLDKVREHRASYTRIAAWLDANPIAMHIPVDSPAANFPICRLAKKRNITVCHLVAPQVWAWATWRIRKLRRLSDLVLCVLPFEERWFRDRNVNARFVGHPLFTHPLDTEAPAAQAADLTGDDGHDDARRQNDQQREHQRTGMALGQRPGAAKTAVFMPDRRRRQGQTQTGGEQHHDRQQQNDEQAAAWRQGA